MVPIKGSGEGRHLQFIKIICNGVTAHPARRKIFRTIAEKRAKISLKNRRWRRQRTPNDPKFGDFERAQSGMKAAESIMLYGDRDEITSGLLWAGLLGLPTPGNDTAFDAQLRFTCEH
ncbi:hypothetical protein ML401_23795 [Bradyrhizobium sp. 62B]|uniref:hypothetical protein n=1 Tax=Bradyrhizobium sp. 62B TaxID=2898442 RepID=UPI002557CD5D|nr:hypothetical protein ML401_23795 [Bradyrhizobium sp. 62B]